MSKARPSSHRRQRRRAAQSEDERQPETQSATAAAAAPTSPRIMINGSARIKRSVRDYEVVDRGDRVQQEVRAAVVRNRDLVNRMLNQRHPVGQQHDTHTHAHENGKQHGPRRALRPSRSLGTRLIPGIETGNPEHGSGKKHDAENQRHVVSRSRRRD